MLRTLLKRQFLEDIFTYRFLTSLVLTLAAIVTFSLIFAGHFGDLQGGYSKASAQNDRNLQAFAKSPSKNLVDAEQLLWFKPKPESFIADGYEDDLPQGFYFRPREHALQVLGPREEAAGVSTYRSISKKERLADVLSYSPDLTFVVQFLLSFFALVLAFDAVTAEKQRGTLRLVYSNPVKRATFVAIKYISALVTMGTALIVGLIMGAIVLETLSSAPLSLPVIASLGLFSLISLLYLSLFILLGMTCSVSSHSSKNSLVLCLLVWVFLVVILPRSMGMFVTSKRYDVPAAQEIKQMAEKAEFDTSDRLEKQLPAEYRDSWEKYKLSEKILRVYSEGQKARQDVLDFYLRKKLAAVSEVRKANFISPASLFEYAASSVSGTGLYHFENLWTQARRYENDFSAFVRDQNSVLDKGAYFHLDDSTISDNPLDFNAIPKFEDRLPRPGKRLKDALPYIGLLALYNLFLFAFVFYKFQSYDVR
jgi:ABC-2 type transport system permease protein